MPKTIVRTCTKCDQQKPLSRFGKDSRYKNGRKRQCKDCDSRRVRERHSTNPGLYKAEYQRRKEYVAEWRQNNIEQVREVRRGWQKNWELNLRLQAIDFLGGTCQGKFCGITDIRVLDIDHINGGGSAERKVLNRGSMYRKIIAGAPGYQLLCCNCHRLKTFY